MTKCIEQDFPCQNPDYDAFDQIALLELSEPISAHELVNESAFCAELPVDDELRIGDITHKLYLKFLRGQTGLYHLWVDYDACDDHGNYTMLCVYVGKGFAELRVDSHIRKKWPKNAQLYVTFTSMENRLSKYYEQLFLDVYDFELNNIENPGAEHLFAVWGEERHHLGTHLNEVSNLSKIQSFDDW